MGCALGADSIAARNQPGGRLSERMEATARHLQWFVPIDDHCLHQEPTDALSLPELPNIDFPDVERAIAFAACRKSKGWASLICRDK